MQCVKLQKKEGTECYRTFVWGQIGRGHIVKASMKGTASRNFVVLSDVRGLPIDLLLRF
jgi:hypothetical protein